MKRPLAATGITCLIALALAVCFESVIDMTIAIMAAIIGVAAVFILPNHRTILLVITIPITLSFGVMALCQGSEEDLSSALGDNTCMITGEVSDTPYRQYNRWYYIIKTDYIGIDGAPQKVKLRLSCRTSFEAKEGDSFRGIITFIQNDNEVGYNSENSLRANGIQARAWCSPYVEPEITHGKSRIKYFPMKIRRYITNAIRDSLPEKYSAMLCAMLLGDTSYLDSETFEHFRASGIAHLVAVSGLHVSLLAEVVASLLRKLKSPVKLNSLLTIAAILLFIAITGFSPSVTRAGIMHIMALIAPLVLRDADSLTSMSLSILIMCLINPWSAADIGLQMSVSSTVGLILLSERIDKISKTAFDSGRSRFSKRFRSYLAETFAVSVTAMLFTMPISAVHFGRTSLIAPITNLFCIYPATIFIIVGALVVILSIIPVLGWILSFIPKLITIILGAYLDIVTKTLSDFPLSSVNSSYDYVPYFFLFALVIIIFAYTAAKYINKPDFTKRIFHAAFCAVFAMLFISMSSHMLTSRGGEIIIFNMQDGGVCVCARSGTHVIISEAGGDSYNLAEINDTLSREGVQKTDAVAVSGKSDERSALADELMEEYSPDYFIYSGDITDYPFAQKAADNSNAQLLSFGSGLELSKLSLSLETYADSDGCGWQLLKCGETDVLICPEDGNCALLPDKYRECDIIVAGDGEISNISYLSAGAVIITSDKRFSEITASKLRVKGFDNIYETSRDGTIICRVKNSKLYIQTSN